MKRGILARQSRAAGWCRLIGALALPVLVLAALGSRFGIVPGAALVPLLALGFVLALLAAAIAGFALADIWRTGAEGAGSAVAAIVYAMPVLLILMAVAGASFFYPRLTEVSTDLVDPPTLEPVPSGGATGMAPERAELQSEAYPDLTPRLYGQPIAAVYTAVRELAEGRGWEIVREAPPAAMTAEAEAAPAEQAEAVDEVLASKATMTQSRTEPARIATAAEPPVEEPPDTGALQAVASTPVFGFEDDVVVRLREAPDGTRVDIRSASRTGQHDLGQNARRIRRFFADLDAALQPDPNDPGAVVAAPAPEVSPEPAVPAIQ